MAEKKKSKKKTLLIIAGIVVVAVIIVLNLTMSTTNATRVQIDSASPRELIELVSASGRIQPQTKVNITSEVNGEIIGLYVREGDRVEVGQLLVQLDTVQIASDVRQAEFSLNEIKARLEGAQTTLSQAEEEFERQQKLFDNGLTSETAFKNAKYDYLNAKAAYAATKAQASQAESRLEKQLDNFSKTRIVAPMPGVITYLDAEVGEIAAAQTSFTQGRTLMTIANLDIFEVEVEVDETEIAKVELGQSVEIEVDAFPDTTFDGEVVEIGNTAIVQGAGSSEQSTNFRVKVIFKDVRKNIRPGMSATVDITTNRRENTLTIPYSAVVMRTLDLDSLERARQGLEADLPAESTEAGSGAVHAAENDGDEARGDQDEKDKKREEVKGTFVVRNGIAEFVPIETGIADQKYIEITAGLSDGDSVISGPYRVLRTIDIGDAVEPRGDRREGGE